MKIEKFKMDTKTVGAYGTKLKGMTVSIEQDDSKTTIKIDDKMISLSSLGIRLRKENKHE